MERGFRKFHFHDLLTNSVLIQDARGNALAELKAKCLMPLFMRAEALSNQSVIAGAADANLRADICNTQRTLGSETLCF